MKKIFCLVLTLLLVFSMAAVFTACGGGGDENGGDVDNGEDYASGGTLVCGVTDYEPMNFRDNAGNWIGFDTEFALLVGEKLGMEVEFQEIAWANKYIELEAGTIDVIWNGFTANAAEAATGVLRTDIVDMSYAYMLNQQCVVVKADRTGEFTSEDDLVGKTIAVESGSAGESVAQDLVGEAGTVLGAAAQVNTFVEVKAGTSDGAVVDLLLAQRMAGSGNYGDTCGRKDGQTRKQTDMTKLIVVFAIL
jgi:polar amino acid transport system substrate-binding protein